MEEKLFCVTFGRDKNYQRPHYDYLKPWNAVRDEETWSLTYIPPSVLNGIEQENVLNGNIIRHKLTFYKGGMEKEMNKCIVYDKEGKRNCTIHTKHLLINPILTLAFDNKEDAERMSKDSIYIGQTQYIVYADGEVKEMSVDDFNELGGVETFSCNENVIQKEFIVILKNHQIGTKLLIILEKAILKNHIVY